MKKLRLGTLVFLALGTATIAQAASDVGPYYWIFKRRDFIQTSTANPVPAGAPFHFASVVTRAPNGSFTGMTSMITPPPTGVVITPQNYSLIADGSLTYDAFFASQANMDSAFGSGGYNLDIRGSMREFIPTLHLTPQTSSFPPEIPKTSNFPFSNGELVVHPTAAFTLNWNSFASHDFVDDVIVLTITRGTATVLREVLPPSATTRAFPANFFQAEQAYTIEISFVKVVEKNVASIAGSTGLTGFASSTRIVMSTSSRVPISGLANLSTRGTVGTGQTVLISGFVIRSTDSQPMRIILRAIGPTLAFAGLPHPLADPVLTLFDAQRHLIATNDNWRTTPSAGLITAAGLNPTNELESAIVQDLTPGPYTAIVTGKNNTTGTGLTEVYNLGSNGQAKLINISTRGQVLTQDDVMICGLVVGGAINHSYLIRALGPSLTNFGVTGVLENPTLQLTTQQGQTIATNDNWRAPQETEIQATGLAPTNDKESAILHTLGPGTYTAIVRGKSMGTGVALVETYALD